MKIFAKMTIYTINGERNLDFFDQDVISKEDGVMPRITDYSFLFQKMFGTPRTNITGSFQLSQLNSS